MPRNQNLFLIQSAADGREFASVMREGGHELILEDTIPAFGTIESARAALKPLAESEGRTIHAYRIVEFAPVRVHEA